MGASMEKLVAALRNHGIEFESGLSPGEFATIESIYGFSFPPDLREFLELGLPISDDFPNWRTGRRAPTGKTDEIAGLLDWPARGMCFDIENSGFWLRDWGPRPDNLEDSLRIARAAVEKAPRLIPVFSHRFLPAEPGSAGNPVLSVYQTDIIYYGDDLVSYFANEFKLDLSTGKNGNEIPRRIRFWNDIIDGADDAFHAEEQLK
jgi:hypothetical protein